MDAAGQKVVEPGARLGAALLTVPRGLMLTGLAAAGGAAAIVTSAAILLAGLAVGLLVVPIAAAAVRELANVNRTLARDWSGVEIPVPYRPRPEFSRNVVVALGQRLRWLATDPASWRDLLWMVLNAPVGIVLGLLPFWLIVYGAEGVLVAPFLLPFVGDDYGYGLSWFFLGESITWGVLAFFQGGVLLLLWLAGGTRMIDAHARFSRWLLAPTRKAELTLQVRHLAQTRSDMVDASAAELRRIERDLHDGAQARLAALSMNIGLAEDMVKNNPDLAVELLVEAREASVKALAELRDLVRGIHPPVLAERGLDGAVRALALSLPLPVEVHAELTGRPQAPVESAGYFAIAESLANVVKHSGAERAWVQVHHEDGRLVMLVGDDGAGGARVADGGGLRGIERRLAAFDGTIAVTSPSGGPTVVTMELPCRLSSPRTLPSSGTD